MFVRRGFASFKQAGRSSSALPTSGKPLRYQDTYNKHRVAVQFSRSKQPSIAPETFVAPSATLAGNIQDRTVILEASKPLSEAHDGSTIIGHYVTVGHGCILRACTIADKCLVGMGSILDEGSYMETESMLAAGSVLEKGVRVPSGELWGGAPARFMRKLTEDEIHGLQEMAENYAVTAEAHREEFDLPVGTAWSDAAKQGIQTGYKEDVLA